MNISEKKTRSALDRWLPLFEGYLTSSEDGHVVLDMNDTIFFANKPIKDFFAKYWQIDLYQGLDLFNRGKFGENYSHILDYVKKAKKGENLKFLESFEIGGKKLYKSITARSFKNADGVSIGTAIEVKDVTEYFELSNQLSEREATLNAVLNATPDGIYALDKNLEIIAINKKAIHEFKEGGFEVTHGVNLHDIVEKEKLDRWMETYFQKVFNGKPAMYEGPLPKVDGTIGFVQNKYRPVLDKNGKIVGILEISRDITEAVNQKEVIQKQLADLDLKNKELNTYIDSNLQLENFAYIASHDLKAPLRSVVSFAHLLKKRVYQELDDKSKKFLDVVIKSSENMQMLIGDLLTYSRVKTETIKLKKIDLGVLMNRILMELDADLTARKVDIKIPENLPTIDGDESLLIQLFSNLIRNAIKFVEKDVIPCIVVNVNGDDLFWKFEVSDNGIGIDQANFEKIFRTFEKLHSNDIFEGTGLGLTICKKIVEKHQGRISVNSKLGEGTTFVFTIMKDLLSKEKQSI